MDVDESAKAYKPTILLSKYEVAAIKNILHSLMNEWEKCFTPLKAENFLFQTL